MVMNKPYNRRKSWSEEESATLWRMLEEGRSYRDIATELGRTSTSVETQASRLRTGQIPLPRQLLLPEPPPVSPPPAPELALNQELITQFRLGLSLWSGTFHGPSLLTGTLVLLDLASLWSDVMDCQPLVGAEEGGQLTVRFIKDHKKLSVYFSDKTYYAIMSWGKNIRTEMKDFEGTTARELIPALEWLHSDQLTP